MESILAGYWNVYIKDSPEGDWYFHGKLLDWHVAGVTLRALLKEGTVAKVVNHYGRNVTEDAKIA